MTEYIIKKYLCGDDGKGRKTAGIILSTAGVMFNLLLFVLKYIGGVISGSIAITADGFNNLADAGSCVLALLGFRLGGKQPTAKYPFGYGRLEYLSGLLISAAILCIGGRMLFSSVGKIISPEPVDGSPAVIIILLISVTVKGYMYRYNTKIGRLIQSSGMRAAALDSLSDCFATLAILAAIAVEHITGVNIDGYTGVLVAMCILYAGATSVAESVQPLLGRGIDARTLEKLSHITDSVKEIRSVSGAALHDYGPNKKLLTFCISTERPEIVIPYLKEKIRIDMGMEAVICPYEDFDAAAYKIRRTRQEYIQTKETQECETIEH